MLGEAETRSRTPCEFAGGAAAFIAAYAHTTNVGVCSLADTQGLPSAEDVDALLRNPLLRAQAVRVVTGGVSEPVHRFSRRSSFNGRVVQDAVDARALRRAFNGGSTVVVEDVGRWHPPVVAMCNSLFNERWLYANASYFVTAEAHCGLPLHADEETTLVFQLAGAKRWEVVTGPAANPGATEVPPDHPITGFTLRPGQAACIPAMYPHRAEAVDDGHSVHLTIGVRPFKLRDLFTDLAERGMPRLAALERELSSVSGLPAALVDAVGETPAAVWQRELAIASIRLASGTEHRGIELVPGVEEGLGGAAADDLIWRVRLGATSLIYFSGTFAVLDDSSLGALVRAVGERRAGGRTWRRLVADGRVPAAVQEVLAAASWRVDG